MNAGLEDDEALAAALAESARLHGESESSGWKLPLSAMYERENVEQVPWFNQFHKPFVMAATKYVEAPTALCGYICMGWAPLLAERDVTQNIEEVVPPVREAVTWLDTERCRYIANQSHRFTSDGQRLRYRRAWVANYEISDYLRREGNPHVVFVRFNQFSERHVATYEEWDRLEEEGTFSDVVLVECFPASGRRLLGEEEGVAMAKELRWTCAVIDLNGHFALAVPRGGRLVLYNTTTTSYLSSSSWITLRTAQKMLYS